MKELQAIDKVIEAYYDITGLHSYFIQSKNDIVQKKEIFSVSV